MKTSDTARPRFGLEDGRTFAPPSGARVRELINDGDPARDLDDPLEGTVLLAGRSSDGSWWWERTYREQAGQERSCVGAVFGGSWDEGDTIRFSSGVRVPKAPTFAVDDAFEGQAAFPGKSWDYVCLDGEGRAVFLKVAHYM